MSTRRVRMGHHRFSGWFPTPVYLGQAPSANWAVKFHESCLSKWDSKDALDWNKCVGISFGPHWQNSARFGWRSNGESIEVFPYLIQDGESNVLYPHVQVVPVRAGELVSMRILCSPGGGGKTNASLLLNGHVIGLGEHTHRGWGYHLNPYFGGTLAAPVDMSIDIAAV